MQLNSHAEIGGYHKSCIRILGSFRIDTGNPPDVIRDGNTNLITSVTNPSVGLYTITLAAGTVLPKRLLFWSAQVAQAANPTVSVRAYIVVDSYSQVTRSFQIQTADFAGDETVDPDDNDMIAFELVGSIDTVGTDAA